MSSAFGPTRQPQGPPSNRNKFEILNFNPILRKSKNPSNKPINTKIRNMLIEKIAINLETYLQGQPNNSLYGYYATTFYRDNLLDKELLKKYNIKLSGFAKYKPSKFEWDNNTNQIRLRYLYCFKCIAKINRNNKEENPNPKFCKWCE